MAIKLDEFGRTLLHNAIIDQDNEAVLIYLNSGIDLNFADNDGWIALHYACQNYNLQQVRLLIENGSEVDQRDSYGNTPLFRAVFNCRDNSGDLIKYLLKNGAEPNLKNKNGVSPLDLANTIANYNVSRYFK